MLGAMWANRDIIDVVLPVSRSENKVLQDYYSSQH